MRNKINKPTIWMYLIAASSKYKYSITLKEQQNQNNLDDSYKFAVISTSSLTLSQLIVINCTVELNYKNVIKFKLKDSCFI